MLVTKTKRVCENCVHVKWKLADNTWKVVTCRLSGHRVNSQMAGCQLWKSSSEYVLDLATERSEDVLNTKQEPKED